MRSDTATIKGDPEQVATAYEHAAGRWTGCDWPTKFGRCRLDLNGLRSSQAMLMARATAGAEAVEWRQAAQWLCQVEQDAIAAEQAAKAALEQAKADNWREAVTQARRACIIEKKYHTRKVWQELSDALETE